MYYDGPLDLIFIDQQWEAVQILQQTTLTESTEDRLERKYRQEW